MKELPGQVAKATKEAFEAKGKPTHFIKVGCIPEREYFIDNLLVRLHFSIVIVRWTGLAPWNFEFPVPNSLTSSRSAASHPIFEWLHPTASIRSSCERDGARLVYLNGFDRGTFLM